MYMKTNTLSIVKEVLDRYYPELYTIYAYDKKFEQEVIHISELIPKVNRTNGIIKIHYPHIEIKNELEESWDIYGLNIIIIIRQSKIVFDIRGYRLTEDMHSFELDINYYHSHLNSNYGNFCLGTVFNEIIQNINEEGINTLNFEYFINYLDSYLKWESIEGRPYSYLRKIGYDYSNVTQPIPIIKDFEWEYINTGYVVTKVITEPIEEILVNIDGMVPEKKLPKDKSEIPRYPKIYLEPYNFINITPEIKNKLELQLNKIACII